MPTHRECSGSLASVKLQLEGVAMSKGMARADGNAMKRQSVWDVIVVGAGPAGLSAALILGRARRRTLVFDRDTPRSWASQAMHGFLTREGIRPDRFRELARAELAAFRNVRYVRAEVTAATRLPSQLFEVRTQSGQRVRSRKILIATGVLDELPPIPGVEKYFGKSVFECPYCDGWETRRARIAVYAQGHRAVEMARAMTAWNEEIVLCTNGASGIPAAVKAQLTSNGIRIIGKRISGLDGVGTSLRAIVFQDGHREPVRALYFDMPCRSQSRLAESLGCQYNRRGGIRCGQYEATNVPGVFVAGNLIKDVQLSIVAAAEGARAAFGINRALTREDFERRATGRRSIDHPPLHEPKTEKPS
jgi:thioredoxin reductase